MKYFTPELIVAYGSDDAATWKEAERQWDAACDRYNVHMTSIKGELPPGLRHIEDSYYLHDSRIQAIGRRDGVFAIVLHLDAPPQSLLTFTYDLVDAPVIVPGALPLDHRCSSERVDWQYGEIEKAAGAPPTWRQSILLSNGWEVVLHFTDVAVEEMQAVLPPSRNGAGAAAPAGLPQSA